MCKYCEMKETKYGPQGAMILETGRCDSFISFDYDECYLLETEIEADYDGTVYSEFEINYCPMCGRKLGD